MGCKAKCRSDGLTSPSPWERAGVRLLVPSYAFVIVYTLLTQDTLYAYCKKCEVAKTENSDPVRVVDAYTFQVGKFALYRWYDGPAKDHHNKKC